jgi:hypothetical protein
MMNETQEVIANEIEAAMDDVLTRLSTDPAFDERFRQLIRNAINNNLADSDVRSVIDAAPTDHLEGE